MNVSLHKNKKTVIENIKKRFQFHTTYFESSSNLRILLKNFQKTDFF